MPSEAAKPPEKKPRIKPGQPEYEKNERDNNLVLVMAAGGISQDRMASAMGIDAKTLRKYFREQINAGSARADAQVVQSLFNMATTGGNVAAAIWWTKTRMRWSERIVVADGSESDLDPASLTDEQIAQRIEKLRRNTSVVRAANSGKVVH